MHKHDRNDDKLSRKANGATIMGWMIAPAMLLATLYVSSVGPVLMPDVGTDNVSNVTQVFSVRYID